MARIAPPPPPKHQQVEEASKPEQAENGQGPASELSDALDRIEQALSDARTALDDLES